MDLNRSSSSQSSESEDDGRSDEYLYSVQVSEFDLIDSLDPFLAIS